MEAPVDWYRPLAQYSRRYHRRLNRIEPARFSGRPVMSSSPAPLLILCCLTAAVFFCSCDRSNGDSQTADSPDNAQSDNPDTAVGDDPREAGDQRSAPTANSAQSQPEAEISLEGLTRDGGYERVGDLPDQSLPPIPENASRSTGLYEKDGERVGFVLVRYPRAGFAKPHVEDISHRNTQGLPVAIIARGREVVEVRSADAVSALRTASELALQLGWPAPSEPAADQVQQNTTP